MIDYKKYINALRKCAKEHEGDRTSTGYIIVSNLCEDTAELLEELEKQHTPETAYWIKIGIVLAGLGYSNTVICKCSNCGHREEFTGKIDGQKLVVDMECADNYCSNCGRQMIEPPQESE